MAIRIDPGKMLKEKVDIVSVTVNNDMYYEEVEEVVFSPRCHFKGVTTRDYKNAISIGTQHEVEVFLRYDSRLTNKSRIVRGDGSVYKVKEILFTGSGAKKFMNVIAEGVDS